MAESLDALAHRFGADKQSGKHGYTRFYERHLRDRKIKKLLEIGALSGASLSMWAEYLTEARIDCIDNDRDCLKLNLPGSRVKVSLCDQNDRIALEAFAAKHGSWDVIVDDGGHFTSYQIKSFEVLWPFINPGGFYAIEDAFCSFIATWADQKPSLFEYFHALCAEHFKGRWYSDDSRTGVDFVEFSTGLIVIGKAA